MNIIDAAKSQNRKRVKRTDSAFQYFEKHHIIPQSMGGIETVLLTAKEHFICHLLLPQMLSGPNRYKMINALIKMAFCKSKGQERYTTRSFAIVRSFIAEKNSYNFKGKPHKHTNNGKTGKWIRTKEHNLATSKRMKGKLVGDKNPFYGKKHSRESIAKRTETRRRLGIKPTYTGKGTHWYTNGQIDKTFFPNDVPAGFIRGRTQYGMAREKSPKKRQTQNRFC